MGHKPFRGTGELFCTNETPHFGTGGTEGSTSGEESANTDTTGHRENNWSDGQETCQRDGFWFCDA